MGDWRREIERTIDELSGTIRDVRRHLHAHPEPSLEEFETAHFLSQQLRREGVPHVLIPSGRGIVADFAPSEMTGPRVAIRADIDALRIDDAKPESIAYRSTRPGVMHACGHDAHASMALGATLALWRCRELLPYPVALRTLFQPAEEVGCGAREMVAAGALHRVKALVALHVDPDRPVGRVGHRAGALTAFCEDLDVLIEGRGGHAARPFQTDDPIGAAAAFVQAVYQLVPRSVDARGTGRAELRHDPGRHQLQRDPRPGPPARYVARPSATR